MRLVEGSDLKAVLRRGAARAGAGRPHRWSRSPARSTPHMRAGSCTATSSLRTCCSTSGEHVYLADFGLSRYLGDAALPLGPAKSLGTADYVAPEQIRGEEVDGRADVYALGCMLYECLAGEPPFRRGTDAATLYAQLEEAPPVLPGLEEVLPKALAKEPGGRYSTCGELIDDSARGARDRRAEAQPLAARRRRRRCRADRRRTRSPSSSPAARRRRASGAGRGFARAHRPEDEQGRRDDAVGRLAGSVAADSRYVWVTSTGDGTVWRIDAKTGSVLKLAAHGTPTAVALGGGKAILADAPEHKIVSLDAATGTVGFVAPLAGPGGFSPLPVAAGPDGVWFADSLSGGSTGLVEKIDDILASGSPSAQIAISGDREDPRLLLLLLRRPRCRGRCALAGGRRSRAGRLAPRSEDAPGRRADPPAVHPEGDLGRRRCRLGDVAARRHRLADRPTDEPHRSDDPGRPRPELDRCRQRRGLGDERDRRRALAHRPENEPGGRADPARAECRVPSPSVQAASG